MWCMFMLVNERLVSHSGFVIGPYVVDAWSLPVYLYIEAAFAFLVMVWILAYFPDKPPTPPSGGYT